MDIHELGRTIQNLRIEQGVSQRTMSEHLAISRATINGLENGRVGDVGIRKIMKILDYLGMELSIRDKSPFPTFEELRDG